MERPIKKIVILSDLHLSYIDHLIKDEDYIGNHREDEILSILLKKRFFTDADAVVLIGDILEMYQAFDRKHYFKKIKHRYPRTFMTILSDPYIYLINGNHDCNALKYFTYRISLDRLFLGGYLFEHGDKGDKFFRSEWRTKLSRFFAKATYFVEGIIGRITKYKFTKLILEHERRENERSLSHESYAKELLESSPHVRGVILGHTHKPFYRVFDEWKDRFYFNTGTYIKRDVWLLDVERNTIQKVDLRT